MNYKSKLMHDLPKFIDNIDFLGQGYNIFYGNPRSTRGLDPDFTNFGVIQIQYDESPYQSLSKDYFLYVLKGISASHQQSCTISFSSKAITSLIQYKDTLGSNASVQGGIGQASFSVSVDYKNMKQRLSSQQSLYVESSARCVAFEVGLHQGANSSPKVRQEFAEQVRDLESLGDNEEAYYNFFDEVGTHVTDEVELGSLFGYRFELSTHQTQELVNTNINVEAQASYLAVQGKAKFNFDQSQDQSFKGAVNSWTSFSIGMTPDADNDPLKWAARTISDPMPVFINLVSMGDFLRTYGSAKKLGMADANFGNLVSRFDKFSSTYCQKRLLLKNIVESCTNQDVVAPIKLDNAQTGNFIQDLSDGNTALNLIQKKSGKFLTFGTINQVPFARIFSYHIDTEQRWAASNVPNTNDVYILKNEATNTCLALQNCNNNVDQFITFADCNVNDPCQQLKINVFNQKFNEVVIQSNKFQNKYMITVNQDEGMGAQAQFSENINSDARVWRYTRALD